MSRGWNTDLALIRVVAAREITGQLRSKAFWASLLVTAAMLCLSFSLSGVLGDGDDGPVTVGVTDGRSTVTEALRSEATVKEYPDVGSARAAVREEAVDAAVLPAGEVIVLRELPEALARTIQQAERTADHVERLRELGATPGEAERAFVSRGLSVTALDEDAAEVQERTMTAGLGVFLLFVLMLISGLGIAQGVAEEKSSRIVEVLLAKVQAWHLLAGKIVGLGAAALVQILLMMTVALGGAISFGVLHAPLDAIGTAANLLLWFVPGYVLFVTLYAVAGALVSRQEDVSHVIGPVNMLQMLSLVGPVLAVQGSSDESLLTVVSMVPGLSWAAMPVRMAAGDVPWWQVSVAFVLMLLAIAGLVRVGGRVYRGGLLRYGGIVRLREVLRSASY
ncbi:ABC transporter permease [Streptomyces sp. JH34]|uniref:ABC transporter permease n=1 Tax=Streptomyces sp. JH34 TaxID=2793633 RepID=UPI0023F9B0B8|nr:ABC transporter permease [Streptomyces sp. JH34]MDF6019128.1 ABC transporter permease [Streptomyces sp. JH34]